MDEARENPFAKASEYEPKIEVQSLSNYGKDELTYVISHPGDREEYLQSIGPRVGIDMIVLPEGGRIYLRLPQNGFCSSSRWEEIAKTKRSGYLLPLYDMNFGKGFKRYNPYSVSEDLRSSNDKLTGRISKLETRIKKLESGKTAPSGKGDADDKLTGRISKLETKIKKLESGKAAPSGKGDTDEITGLDARVASLEDFVKIDRKQLPSSDPKAGLGYFIHRNWDLVQANQDVIFDNANRIFAVENKISSDYKLNDSYYLKDLIDQLTSRVTEIESAVM